MIRIHFVLIGEGGSDEALIRHIERLCVDAGADEVTGTAPDLSLLPSMPRTIEKRIRAVAELEPSAQLLFIHKDADSRNPEPRIASVHAAVENAGVNRECVAIVPVQETEAWLLLDESAIRAVAGHPNGHKDLHLPAPQKVENVAHPKERLKQALVAASEFTGRRLGRFRQDFSTHRRLLLERLPVGGALGSVSAWCRLRDDIRSAVTRLDARS